ncbi:MAG: hypothetical protein ABJD07_14820 [Gemmatimonadaceae bacterium]
MRTMKEAAAECGPGRIGSPQIGMALLAAAALIAASWTLKHVELGAGARLAVAFAPLPAYALFLRSMWQAIRSTDELQQRIQLEALAFTFGGTVLATIAHDYLRKAGFGAAAEEFPLLAIMAGLYIVGVLAGRRRFR